MPADLPLSTVVVEIVRHTPGYAWAILAVLVALGARQWRDHTVTRPRLLLAAIGLGAFSLWGAIMAFGTGATVVAAWLAGIAGVVAANRRLRRPRDVRQVGAGVFAVPGSAWPLIVMLGIFGLRYAVAVTLVFHHDWAAHAGFALPLAGAYGAASGFFAARALRVLGTARGAPSLHGAQGASRRAASE